MFIGYIFLALGLVLSLYVFFSKDEILKNEPTAINVLIDNLKDPRITSRAYFTETSTGPIGSFVGYSPVSQDDWLHSFPHEEPQDERSEYDKISSLI